MMRLFLVLLCMGSLWGCGGPRVVTTKPAPAPAPAEPDDAFASFGGQIATAGEAITLRREPVGFAETRAMIILGKTEWIIRTRADGSEEKTATANFVIQHGDKVSNVRIQAGESGSAAGIQIQVHEAGETYEEASMRWVQFAKVTLTATP